MIGKCLVEKEKKEHGPGEKVLGPSEVQMEKDSKLQNDSVTNIEYS